MNLGVFSSILCTTEHEGHVIDFTPLPMLTSGSLSSELVDGLFTIFFATPFLATRFFIAFFLTGAALGFSSSSSVSSVSF